MNRNHFSAKNIATLLPKRPRDSYKHQFGHVVIIGGDYGMPGAVRMTAESALRSGAGLVSVVTRPEHISGIISYRPEIMCLGINTPENLEPLLKKASVIILGPGLGRSEWSKELFACAMQPQHRDIPMLIDADGLYWLSQFELTRDNWILTPHPGEAALLLQTDAHNIQQNRLGALGMLQLQYGGVIVLKGFETVIVGHDHQPTVCQKGNPGMSTAGMGDILSGIIGGLMAQHLPLETAARLGVFIHASCGDLAARQHGERGLLANDLCGFIQKLVNPG